MSDALERGSPVVVAGWFDLADPSVRDSVVERSVPFQQATRDEETGCLTYVLGADPAVTGRIQMVELWENEAALQGHFEHPNYARLLETLGGEGLVGSESAKHRVIGVDSLRDAPSREADGPVVVLGTIELSDSADAAEVAEATAAPQLRSRTEEAGCEAYVFMADPSGDTSLHAFQQWADHPSLDAHFIHPSLQDMGAALGSHATSTSLVRVSIDGTEPIYDETGRPQAHFADNAATEGN